MLSLKKCLRDIVNAWPKISVGTQSGSLKIGSLLIQWGNTSMTIPSGVDHIKTNFIDFPIEIFTYYNIWTIPFSLELSVVHLNTFF